VLDSTIHGEDVAKRRDPNQPKVGSAGPTNWPASLVFAPNESSLLHMCRWRPGDKESEETKVVRPKAVAGLPSVSPWRIFLPQCRPPAPINTPTSFGERRIKSAKVASTSASTFRFCRMDRETRFGGLLGLSGVLVVA
jgi:hypothetical protein